MNDKTKLVKIEIIQESADMVKHEIQGREIDVVKILVSVMSNDKRTAEIFLTAMVLYAFKAKLPLAGLNEFVAPILDEMSQDMEIKK